MKKDKVLKLFGGLAETAKACGVTRQAVEQWPPILSGGLSLRVVGAAMKTDLEGEARKAFPLWFAGSG